MPAVKKMFRFWLSNWRSVSSVKQGIVLNSVGDPNWQSGMWLENKNMEDAAENGMVRKELNCGRDLLWPWPWREKRLTAGVAKGKGKVWWAAGWLHLGSWRGFEASDSNDFVSMLNQNSKPALWYPGIPFFSLGFVNGAILLMWAKFIVNCVQFIVNYMEQCLVWPGPGGMHTAMAFMLLGNDWTLISDSLFNGWDHFKSLETELYLSRLRCK